MQIGIDSYCYHRYFGEVYPVQTAPDTAMTVDDFLVRASELGADGVSLESCFLPRRDPLFLSELCGRLDELGLDRVYAWGHPNGLLGGKSPEAYEDMLRSLEQAKALKADVMRVVGNNGRFRFDEHEKQIDRLSKLFADAVKEAERQGIRLAIENHQDFTLAELETLIENVDSPFLGLTFDSGNCLRILDDPIKGLERIGDKVYATHIKDIRLQKGMPADMWQFFACVPAGQGVVDLARIIEILNQVGYRGSLTVEQFNLARENIPGIEWIPTTGIIEELRAVKQSEEIHLLEQAAELAAAGFQHILNLIEPGAKEQDLALELEIFMRKNGAEAPAFDIILISGAKSSLQHGTPSQKKIEAGDLVVLDFGARYRGYRSDITRTVAVNHVSQKQREIYDLVKKAQSRGLELIKPGMSSGEIYREVQEIIARAGYADYSGRGIGHGVGLEIHEDPAIRANCDAELKIGQVLTMEPGIYIPGWGGVRIEDTVVVEGHGCRVLAEIPKDLIIL